MDMISVLFLLTGLVCALCWYRLNQDLHMVSTDTLNILFALMLSGSLLGFWAAVDPLSLFPRYLTIMVYAFLPPIFIRLLTEFLTHIKQRGRRFFTVCYGISALFSVICVINPGGLFFSDTTYGTRPHDGEGLRLTFAFLEFDYGPLFYAFLLYLLCVLAWGMVQGGKICREHPRKMPIILAFAIGLLPPVLCAALYIFRVLPLDFTGAACAVFALLLVQLRRKGFFLELPTSPTKTIAQMPDGLVIRNPNGHVVEMNPAAAHMLELEDNNDRLMQARDLVAKWGRWLQPGKVQHSTQIFQHSEKGERHYHVFARMVESHVSGRYYSIFTLSDETAPLSSVPRTESLSHFDNVTGLSTRSHFLTQLNDALKKSGGQVVLLCASIHRYGEVNDTHGHLFSMELVQIVARRLRTLALRIKNTQQQELVLGRFNDDIFYLFLPVAAGNPADTAKMLQEQISSIFKNPVLISSVSFPVILNLGAAFAPLHSQNAVQLSDFALAAMQSCAEKRLSIATYTPDEMQGADRQRIIRDELTSAISRGELSLAFQPQVSQSTGMVYGCEALLRWKNEKLGTVSPGEFIPIAEETGLMPAIGQFALRSAIMQAQQWHTMGVQELRISVNVGLSQLRDPKFVESVQELLRLGRLAPQRLELEISESVALSPEPVVSQQMQKLRDLGVRLAVDNFGLGQASLLYLKTFLFDTVKVDRVLAYDIHRNRVSAAMLQSIHTLCQALDIELVVEFIERKEQAALLNRLGIDRIQGYYFSPALAPTDFLKLVKERNRIPDDAEG